MGSVVSKVADFCDDVAHVFTSIGKLVRNLVEPPKRPVDLTPAIQISPPTDSTPANKPVTKPTQEELAKMARSKLGIDIDKHYNFAFVGQSGVGKSSLINAVRMLKAGDPGAAPVGETQTTMEAKRYMHPFLSHIALWDLPGAGTLDHPAESYFEKQMLYAYDCILILTGDRFMDIDFQIAKKALEYQKACAFVRTKADQGVKAIARRKKKTMREASEFLRLQVNASFKENADNYGLPKEARVLFIVSAWAMRDKHAYANCDDESLEEMDEKACIKFVDDAVSYRT